MQPRPFQPTHALLIALALLAAQITPAAASTAGNATAVTARVRQFLDAYAANDQASVLRMIDTRQFTMYGSDISEVVHTPGELKRFMDDDFRLWHTSKIGPIADLDLRIGHEYASAFFDAPFSAGGAPTLRVRFATVWHKVDGAWLLTQSANCVPTSGSSAREILQKQSSLKK